jgi:excisionase family DNA binding protein
MTSQTRKLAAQRMTARTQRSERDTEAAAFGFVRGRHRRNEQIKFFTIAEIAERLHVSTRTVRRWIKEYDLIAHRVGGVVRIAENDLRAFLATHREA